MTKKSFAGTYTAIVTPFNDDFSIDYEAFAKLIEFQISGGIDGIVVCGSTGESATLTAKEKLALIIFAVEKVQGRIKVIAGTGSNSTADSIDLTLLAKEHGADAALLVSPYYNKPTQEGLYNHYKAIAEAVPELPLILYNVPGRTAVNIQAEIQLRLAKECNNIVATKEASGNFDQIMQIINNAPAGFEVLSGEDSQTMSLIAAGAVGTIAVVSNYAPRIYSDMVQAALAGNFSDARKHHYKIFELMMINFIETNPIPVKAALGIMGLIKENYRLPLLPIHNDNRKKIEKAMKKAKLL